MFLLTGKTLLMKVATQLNLVANLAHPSFKTLHNQSMHKLVMIFLYPHSLVTKMVHYLLVLLNSKNAVLHCSFQNGYLKTVFNVTNVPSYVHMLQFVQSLATEAEVAAAPEHFDTIPALGAKDLQFRIAVSPLDCFGLR